MYDWEKKPKELNKCYLLTYHKKTEVSNYQQNQQQTHQHYSKETNRAKY